MTRHIRQMRRREEELSSSYVPTHCHLCLSKHGTKKKSCLSLTFFRLVVPVLAELPVVVLDELVVVVLGPPLAALALITGPVVLVAVQTLVPQGKEVTGSQLLTTGHAHETLHRQTIS